MKENDEKKEYLIELSNEPNIIGLEETNTILGQQNLLKKKKRKWPQKSGNI